MKTRISKRRWLSLGVSLALLGSGLPVVAGPPQIPIRDCICDPVHNNFGYYPARWHRWPAGHHGPVMVPTPDRTMLPTEALPPPGPSTAPRDLPQPPDGMLPEEQAPPSRQPTPLGLPTMPDVRPGLPDVAPPPSDTEPMPPEETQPQIPSRDELQQLPDDSAPQPPGEMRSPLSLPPESADPLQPPPDESGFRSPGTSGDSVSFDTSPMLQARPSAEINRDETNQWRRAVREASAESYELDLPSASTPELFEPAQSARPVRERMPADDESVLHKPTTATRFDTQVRAAADWQPLPNASAPREPQRLPLASPLRANPLR